MAVYLFGQEQPVSDKPEHRLYFTKVVYKDNIIGSVTLPEYLRDFTKPQEGLFELSDDNLYDPTDEELAGNSEEDIYYNKEFLENTNSEKYPSWQSETYLDIRQESDRQEAAGLNSWLSSQGTTPKEVAKFNLIRKFGYVGTHRNRKSSLIRKNILKELKSSSDIIDDIKYILREFKLDPAEFVEIRETLKLKN